VHTIDLGRHVVVYGPSGSGKTTVGRLLAARLQVPFTELDAVFHARPGWHDLSREELRGEVAALLAAHPDGWVLDGNYDHVRDLVLPRTDSVVWLRLPFPVVYARLVSRTLRRAIVSAELWNGNRETLRQTFLSRDSMLLWGVTAWRAHHRAAERALATLPHGPVYELRSPRAVRRFLDALADGGSNVRRAAG
jgi:adenylate kinase family enzyme